MPAANEPFVCRGCGRPIDKADASLGHSDSCPFWGSLENARIDRNSLHELFRSQAIPGEQYAALRAVAYEFANAILSLTPASREQQLALRRLRDVLMIASQMIVGREIMNENREVLENLKNSPPAGPEEAAKAQTAKVVRTGGRRRKVGKR